jgi:D-alanyl-D-alanine carboxypeptidase
MLRKILFLFILLFSTNSIAIQVTAKSWLVTDGEGNIIDQQNIESKRPIASITKLMTAMVVLDSNSNLDEKLDKVNLTRRQMIQLSLVKSDNRSAALLCKFYPGGWNACIESMNRKAMKLGMCDTSFDDSTGLSRNNISSAKDLIRLVKEAEKYPEIVEASQTSNLKIKTKKKKWTVVHNTNPIIGHRHHFIVSKTGFTNPAGGCIVMMLDTRIGRRIVVLLGSRNMRTRIPEAEFIALKAG